eukprot:Unigene6949_Nuclearia_a/m.21282 Unigene6949_Nuclearia_a/g.21282  ORF Unigene6949_Nuclearia_a/g.21282 Unigene6949_Nuclearia_a/m.21282 type:complete len:104 (+) Unigene6949_Nuclearia_a:274-585(+)
MKRVPDDALKEALRRWADGIVGWQIPGPQADARSAPASLIVTEIDDEILFGMPLPDSIIVPQNVITDSNSEPGLWLQDLTMNNLEQLLSPNGWLSSEVERNST